MRRFVITRGVAVWNGERYVTESVDGFDYSGPWALAMDTSPTWVAQDYRLYADTGLPGSTALANENTAASILDGSKFRLRVAVGETANATINNVGSWLLQFSVNGGAFATVTGATSVSEVTSDDALFVDGAALTQALGGVTGSAAYQATWSEADEDNAVTSRTWTDNDTEYEYCLALSGTAAGDTVTFRMLSPAATAITFTNVPTVNVIEPTFPGTGTPSLPLLTASGSGKKARKGTGTPSLPILTASGTGKRTLRSTGTPSLPLLTASGSGTKTRKGTGTPTLPLLTASGTGTKTRKGTGTPSLPLLTASGTGTKARKGAGTPVLPILTASGAGTVSAGGASHPGTGAPSLPLLTAGGAGTKTRKGTGTPGLPLLTASGAGTKTRKGTGAPSLPLLTASGAGTKARKGTGTVSLPILTASGSATKARTGAGAPSIPLLTASGVGKRTLRASGTPSLPLLVAAGIAKRTLRGTGAVQIPLMLASGVGAGDMGFVVAPTGRIISVSSADWTISRERNRTIAVGGTRTIVVGDN